MKRVFATLLTLLATTAQAEAPRVATDIAPVHGLVAAVMAGTGTPDLVVPIGADPHGYAMRPSEARALSQADVVFWVGPSLAPWLAEPVETLATQANLVTLEEVEGLNRLELRNNARFVPHDHSHDGGHDHAEDHGHDDGHASAHAHSDDHGHADNKEHAHDHAETHDHDHGHEDHAGHEEIEAHGAADEAHPAHVVDSHFWLDPYNAILWVAEIARVLSEHDPQNAALYQDNAAAITAQIKATQEQVRSQLAPLADRPFIVFHDAYQYFETRFGVTAQAAVTLADAGAASAARLAEVREVVAETGAGCALAEPRASQGLIDAVAEGAQIRVVRVDALGVDLQPGPAFYPQLITQIGAGLAACLSGTS